MRGNRRGQRRGESIEIPELMLADPNAGTDGHAASSNQLLLSRAISAWASEGPQLPAV